MSGIPEMLTFKVSLQYTPTTGTVSGKIGGLYRLIILEDGDGCEGLAPGDLPKFVSEWIGMVKSGGHFAVYDLRKPFTNGEQEEHAGFAETPWPDRPKSIVTRLRETTVPEVPEGASSETIAAARGPVRSTLSDEGIVLNP